MAKRDQEALSEGSEGSSRVVLYRCPTPTNWLCPCGGVARRLRKLGVEYETVRVPYRRAARPEIEELTRQRLLPVLVLGDDVIHDSKRIIEHLEWRSRTGGLYNAEHDGDAEGSDHPQRPRSGEDQGVHGRE